MLRFKKKREREFNGLWKHNVISKLKTSVEIRNEKIHDMTP